MSNAFFAAIFVSLLLSLGIVLANIFVFLRLLPQPTGYTNQWSYALQAWQAGRPSRLAAAAWIASLSVVWLAPLMPLLAPTSLVMGVVERRRVRQGLSGPGSAVAARMAITNGCIFTGMSMVLATIYAGT